MRVYLNTLGCVRNLVDSEIMAAAMVKSGALMAEDPAEADTIVVNTCSFIESAINESVDTILALAAYKKNGNCRRLIVTGCLPERFGQEIAAAIPEVDIFLGTGAYDQITDAAAGRFAPGTCRLPPPDSQPLPMRAAGRKPSTYPVAYVKIGDGCNRRCTYCVIPKLRGRLRSRPATDILAEAEELAAQGFKEIALIAQDTSAYGLDLTPRQSLAALLDRLGGMLPDTRIRFLYGSPDYTDAALIATVAKHPAIAPYFDLPIQHVSPGVLKRMGRKYAKAELLQLFEQIRAEIPAAALRTTLLVGFPGETEAEFNELLDFLETVRLDHVGVFIYSDAEDLTSHSLPDHVGPADAKARYERLMTRQAEISLGKNQNRIGKTYTVLVEHRLDNHLYVGRAMFQAPEVDGVIYIESPGLSVGDLINIRITEAYAYDLKGEPEWPV